MGLHDWIDLPPFTNLSALKKAHSLKFRLIGSAVNAGLVLIPLIVTFIYFASSLPHCDRLDNWKILSGGALNTTYQLQIDSTAFVLRLYTRDRSHYKTEIAIHSLIDGNVPSPRLIYANDSHQPWAYAIFEFVEGCHISQVSEEHKTTLSFELGKILASIHSFKFFEAGLFG